MRLALVGVVAAMITGAATASLSKDKGLTSQDLSEFLHLYDPTTAYSNFTLEGCQYATSEEQAKLVTYFSRYDLSVFDFEAFTTSPVTGDWIVASFNRKSASKPLAEQAQKLMHMMLALEAEGVGMLRLTPNSEVAGIISQLDGDSAQLSKELVSEFFMHSNDPVVFELLPTEVEGELEDAQPLMPHEDAKEFFDFIQHVEALEGPLTVQIRKILVAGRGPDALYAASVSIPSDLGFIAKSREAAESLRKILFQYQNEHCTG